MTSRLSPCWLAAAFCLCAFPAAAGAGYGYESSFPFIDLAIEKLGYIDLYGEQRDAFAYVLLFYAFCFGILTHLALKELGFGFILNAVIGCFGVVLGAYLTGPRLHLLTHMTERGRLSVIVVACGLGSALLLVLLAFIREKLFRGFNALLYAYATRSRRRMKAEAEAEQDPMAPRVAAALRQP